MRFRFIYLLLVVLLFVSACGQRDQYTIGEPENGHTITSSKSMTVHNLTLPLLGAEFNSHVVSAWDVNDILVGCTGGVARIVSGLITDTHWPTGTAVVGLKCLSNGTAWGVDVDGKVCRWDGDSWLLENESSQFACKKLLIDSNNRPIVFGNLSPEEGVIYRRENSQWRQITPADFPPIQSASVGLGDTLYAVSDSLVLYRETGSEWIEDHRFEEPEVVDFELNADGNGNFVLYDKDSSLFWLKVGQSWSRFQPVQGYYEDNRNLYWENDQLLGLLRSHYHSICRWEQDEWIVIEDIPSEVGYLMNIISLDDNRVIHSSGGLIWTCEDGNYTQQMPRFFEIDGAVLWQDQVHLLTNRGAHFVADEQGWRLLGFPSGGPLNWDLKSLTIDDTGMMVFVGGTRVAQWDGLSYEISPTILYVDVAFPQYDGSVLTEHDDQIGIVINGTHSLMSEVPDAWRPCRSMALDQDGRRWMAGGCKVGYEQYGAVFPSLFFSANCAQQVVFHPASGLIVKKTDTILLLNNGEWEDITPSWPESPSTGLNIWNITYDNSGRLAMFESSHNGIFVYSNGKWTKFTFNYTNGKSLSWGSYIRAGIDTDSNGNVAMWREEMLLLGNYQGTGE